MTTSKYFTLVFFLLCSATSFAQDAQDVVEQYKKAIGAIESVHCEVTQVDTFVTGTSRRHIGELTMLRSPQDTLFGFLYKAKKDVGGVALYDGLSDFQIDHTKRTYEVMPTPKSYILGSPGGQLVIPELLNYQDPETTPELVVEGAYFMLRYQYPDIEEYDVRKREKWVFLDKTTFLPQKVVKRQETLGKKQVITRIVSGIQLNRADEQEGFQKDFLASYKMILEDDEDDLHTTLLQTEVKALTLPTFSGAEVSTRPEGANLLLLDFWEVWCGPCIQSMPKVQQLADKYGDEGLQVIGVLMDPKTQDSAERLISKQDIAFLQTLGDEEVRAYFRVNAIPQYVLIDGDGIIQAVFLGYENKMEGFIKRLLRSKK